MIENEPKNRRFQFRIKDLLLVVLIVGLGLALYLERSHRVVLQKKLESLGSGPLVWVWHPQPNELHSADATSVAVAGNVFVPRSYRVTSPPVIEVACWRANQGNLVRIAPPVMATIGQKPSGNFGFHHNYQRGTPPFPTMPAGTYLVEATMLIDGKPVAVGFTRFVTVAPKRNQEIKAKDLGPKLKPGDRMPSRPKG